MCAQTRRSRLRRTSHCMRIDPSRNICPPTGGCIPRTEQGPILPQIVWRDQQHHPVGKEGFVAPDTVKAYPAVGEFNRTANVRRMPRQALANLLG